MMSHFAKLKGCIVGTQKEAFQKHVVPSSFINFLRICIDDANSNRNAAFSVLYCVNAQLDLAIPIWEKKNANFFLLQSGRLLSTS